MSEQKKVPTPKPSPVPPEKRTRSGEHEAVRSYRAKMESISDEDGGTQGAILNLDKALEEYLQEARSLPPPALEGPPTPRVRVVSEPECEHGTVPALCRLCVPRP